MHEHSYRECQGSQHARQNRKYAAGLNRSIKLCGKRQLTGIGNLVQEYYQNYDECNIFFQGPVHFFLANTPRNRAFQCLNWIILERFEPKKSTKVTLGASGGSVQSRRVLQNGVPVATRRFHTLQRALCEATRRVRKRLDECDRFGDLCDFERSSRSAQCDFVGLLELKPL